MTNGCTTPVTVATTYDSRFTTTDTKAPWWATPAVKVVPAPEVTR